jgi:hypothetical protein
MTSKADKFTDEEFVRLWHGPERAVAIAETLDMSESELYGHWRRLRTTGKIPTSGHRPNVERDGGASLKRDRDALRPSDYDPQSEDGENRERLVGHRDRLLERLLAAHGPDYKPATVAEAPRLKRRNA